MINQGSSEVSIMFGIDEADLDTAIIALYNGSLSRSQYLL